jgi:hypothetical protein
MDFMKRTPLSFCLLLLSLSACSFSNTAVTRQVDSNTSSNKKLSSQLSALMMGAEQGRLQDHSCIAGAWTDQGLLLDIKTQGFTSVDADSIKHRDITLVNVSEKYQRISVYVRSYQGINYLSSKDFVRRIDSELGARTRSENCKDPILKGKK